MQELGTRNAPVRLKCRDTQSHIARRDGKVTLSNRARHKEIGTQLMITHHKVKYTHKNLVHRIKKDHQAECVRRDDKVTLS